MVWSGLALGRKVILEKLIVERVFWIFIKKKKKASPKHKLQRSYIHKENNHNHSWMNWWKGLDL